jgi:hypothetical protein
MAYGAYMTVTNRTQKPITTLINNVECMYDHGDERSNLSLFNNVTIKPGDSLPGATGQFIKAKASGGCAFKPSYFTLQVVGVGTVGISERHSEYSGKSVSGIALGIDNSGKQATITMLVYTPGTAEAAEFEAELAAAPGSPESPPPPTAPQGAE